MCVDLKGAVSDSCWAYVVGKPSEKVKKLMEVTKKPYTLVLNKHKWAIVLVILVMLFKHMLKEKALVWYVILLVWYRSYNS